MRKKNNNKCHIEGYLYDVSKLQLKVTGEKAKTPGVEFIRGELYLATDEAGLNVVPVYFTYKTENFGKTNKKDPSFNVLKELISATDRTWLTAGKDNALKVSVDGSLEVNDFWKDDQLITSKRVSGGRVVIVNELNPVEDERNTFALDMIINRVVRKEANPEAGVENDYALIGGAAFDFKNSLLPCELRLNDPNGIALFESMSINGQNMVFTSVWGNIINQTIKKSKVEESAFGAAKVTTTETRTSAWVITGTAKNVYDFGDPDVLTVEDLTKAQQDREVYLADKKRQQDEYMAEKNGGNAGSAGNGFVQIGNIPAKDFKF